MCQRGNPSRVVAPVGVPGSYGAPPAWEAPGRLGTAAAGGLRCVPGSPVTQGFPDIMVWHGRTDAQGGALVPPPVESIHFIRAVGPHMRHEPGGHIVPLAGVVHGGRRRVPRPMAKGDVCHGAGFLREVAGPQSKQPSDADCQGDLLPCGKPGDP